MTFLTTEDAQEACVMAYRMMDVLCRSGLFNRVPETTFEE